MNCCKGRLIHEYFRH